MEGWWTLNCYLIVVNVMEKKLILPTFRLAAPFLKMREEKRSETSARKVCHQVDYKKPISTISSQYIIQGQLRTQLKEH